MMPASKHGDPQLGIDIHFCIVPPSPAPVPLPTPHISIVFDPFDYVPFIGGTVTVCGMKRATAGTGGIVIHIPPGFPFAPKFPAWDDELFMGSSTVIADSDPFSYLALPVLGCQIVGMPSIPRLKKKAFRIMLLPTTFNLAIPTGVVVGGAPTISLMGLAFKGAFAALGKFAKSGLFKRVRQKLFGGLNPGFVKCKILRAEPVNILTGEVSVQQEDFTLPGRIPIEWCRAYTSGSDHDGLCGHGWETPADTRLEIDPLDGLVSMRHPTVGPLFFSRLPIAEGEEAGELEMVDGARLTDQGHEYQVRTTEDRIYSFPKALARIDARGGLEYPIGRLADLCGNWLDFDWRGAMLSGITESAGRRINIAINDGRITEVTLRVPGTDVDHTFVRYEYNEAGDLVAAIDALGHPYRFAYDEHHMVRHIDRNGLSFHYEYDKTGEDWRVAHSWGDGGLYDYQFEYIDVLKERRITDSLGHVSIVTLDDRGLPVCEIDPLGGRTVFEYDEAGRTTAVVDQDGHRTAYQYDEHGNVLNLTRPDGSTLSADFDAANRPVIVTHPDGARWLHEWDVRGVLRTRTTPGGYVWRYEYDDFGQMVAVTNPRTARTEFQYDHYGSVSVVTSALGHRTRFAHDVLGNITTRVDPLGGVTSYRYDARSRLVAVHLPSDSAISCDYDAEDGLVRYTDENGAETKLEYCGQGEIAARIHADGHSVRYHYDTEERLTGVVNERRETYRIRRDALGRTVEEVDYWGQSRRYSYSPGGHLERSVDPLGRVIAFAADPLGRIVRRSLLDDEHSGAPFEETFSYDGRGNITACVNANIRVERRFDAEGRMLEERQGDAVLVRYAYDEVGNRTSQTTEITFDRSATTRRVSYSYDLLDQAVEISGDTHEPIRIDRDAVGRVVREQFSPLLCSERSHLSNGLLSRQRLIADGRVVADVAYDYDPAGNLIARVDADSGVDRHAYDPVGRVIAHLDPAGRLERYVHDPSGDRFSMALVGGTGSGAAVQLVGAALAAPAAVASSAPSPDVWWREAYQNHDLYRFDRAGNLIERYDHRGELRLMWDATQRIIESRANGLVTSYYYDPLGRRIGKQTGETRVAFVWDGNTIIGDVLIERESDRPACVSRVREWLYFPGTFEPLMMIVTAGDDRSTFYYQNDPNGCPTQLVDAAGAAVWSAAYGPWGELRTLDRSDVDNPIRLQGQYYDDETALSYNRYRYYSPDLGQFVSQDPIRLGAGPHLYAYGPNATLWTDPLGLTCVHRFHTAGDPATLLPNLTRAGVARRAWVNLLMNVPWYREWRAHRHMRGDTRFSPFVSVVTDPSALARSSDSWARTITTGMPGTAGVRRAPDLSTFDVPPDRLIGPRASNPLSIAETEMVTWGNDLGSFMTGTRPNPF